MNITPDLPADQVDYIIFAPTGDVTDFTPFTRARAVLSLWAGVEKIVGNDTLRIPLTRMVDTGLVESGAAYADLVDARYVEPMQSITLDGATGE